MHDIAIFKFWEAWGWVWVIHHVTESFRIKLWWYTLYLKMTIRWEMAKHLFLCYELKKWRDEFKIILTVSPDGNIVSLLSSYVMNRCIIHTNVLFIVVQNYWDIKKVYTGIGWLFNSTSRKICLLRNIAFKITRRNSSKSKFGSRTLKSVL